MRLLIYGSREFASTVTELSRHCGHDVIGMVDDFNRGPGIVGCLESIVNTYPSSEFDFAIGIGYSNLKARWLAWKKIKSLGYETPALIHPCAYVADSARIGEGSMVMAGANVDVHAQVGDLSVIWPGACVSHNTIVGTNSFLSPNSTLCGYVNMGDNCFVGAGAVVADHCNVPSNTFIKMLSGYKGDSK